MALDTDREGKYKTRKDTEIFLMRGVEYKIMEKTEALYASIRLWGVWEDSNIPFPYWKVVD